MREAMARLQAEMASCAATAVWAMSDDEAVAWLDDLIGLTGPLVAMQAQALRDVDARGVPAAHGARGVVAWLKERFRLGHREARRLVELGRLLGKRPALDRALTAGTANVEQVEAIGGAIGHLAAEPEVGPDVVDRAETALLGHTAEFEPRALQSLGGRILAHVAPDLADRVDATILARQEERGHATRSFQLTAVGDGRVRCTGWLDVEGAAIVQAAIDPLSSPRRYSKPLCGNAEPSNAEPSNAEPSNAEPSNGDPAKGDPANGDSGSADVVVAEGDDRTPAQRRADALVEVCRLALHTTELPVNGGDRPQLVVTVPYDIARKELGIGQLDTGEQLTASQVRQLACDALIIPAVLGSAGQVLDYGRSRRLITGPLRRALVLRDRGCTFPGCDRPARWTDAHHVDHWADGGRTCIDTCALLCRRHHRVIHRRHWTMRMAADGHPEFIPPPWIDPSRTPRRNAYHRRC